MIENWPSASDLAPNPEPMPFPDKLSSHLATLAPNLLLGRRIMSTQDDYSRSPSYDPSVSTIENRVFIYDPDTANDDEDDDDMDYVPAEESLDEGEEEDMDEVDFEGGNSSLEVSGL